MAFIILGAVLPVLAIIVPFLGLPLALTAPITVALLVGGPEVCLIIGAALSGKKAIQVISEKFKRFFLGGLAKTVTRRRHRVGVTLLILGNAILFFGTYIPLSFAIDLTSHFFLYFSLSGDILCVISFFVLGNPFWEKIKHLFTWTPEQTD